MANPEHLKILRKGREEWNSWRKKNPDIIPDLSRARLYVNEAKLNLFDLNRADLKLAEMDGANCYGTDFTGANLTAVRMREVDFRESAMAFADLSQANLENSDFRKANFIATRFWKTSLNGANFSESLCSMTVLANLDLSAVYGLDSVVHLSPSSVGIDTLLLSRGQIPDVFLRDSGAPEEIIDIARSIRNGLPIQCHSCFIIISHSTKDEEFARRLHSRMREANMRVWLASEDLKGGKKLHEQLFEAIQIHDRLLIVLSEHSIQSEWVMTEIRKAREVEKKEERRKLFPIRLTDFETLRDWTCFDADTGKDLAVEVREYFIPDFSNWKNHDAFESAFVRLKKDLEAENSRR